MCESRCGVGCGSCDRKEQVGCKGCINMSAPFWGGVCGVKKCCENKGLKHCGICPEFPCTMVAEMGVKQGLDPAPRLENLRKWSRQA